MISVDNLTKSYGGQALFDAASFKINPRERVGLVGRNGHGKTTLLRLITGEVEPDNGQITFPRHYRIGYVTQTIDFTEETVLSEGMKGLPDKEKDHYWKVEKILGGLGYSKSDMNRHPGEFSGGFQVRLNLAKVIVSDPDLLLLDEPTNYLDITSIRWIQRFLLSWPHELMLITHDRNFMDSVVTHVLGIHRKKVRKISGDTEKYYTQIASEEEIYEKTRLKDEKRRKEMELFITRFRAKARLANMVQSRIKTLARQERKDKLYELETLDFKFRGGAYKGKQVMTARNIDFSYGGPLLINDFNITIGSGDRVCVIGRNGKGKTTLLKLLAGDISPLNGSINYNPGVERGFFEQSNIKTLVDSRTVEEELLCSHPDVDRQLARNICGAMMFEGDDALKKISVLSGGEKSRVMLGKLLVTPLDILLLDEPTNHLDMESCDALLAAIDNFDGAVVMVTHNEMFLKALARRLIVFQGAAPYVFEGGYRRFLEKVGWEGEGERGHKAANGSEETGSIAKLSKKEIRRKRSEIISTRSKELQPAKDRINALEHDIEIKEKNLSSLNHDMQEVSLARDVKKMKTVSMAIHKTQSEIDSLFNELEKLTAIVEKKETEYNAMLEAFDESMGL